MCAYLTGATQAPLTSAVISLELTDSGDPAAADHHGADRAWCVGLVCGTTGLHRLAELLMEPKTAEDVAVRRLRVRTSRTAKMEMTRSNAAWSSNSPPRGGVGDVTVLLRDR
jgi:hypothetical protein